MQNWLITGCSSGIGRALARAVLARGWCATITARNPRELENIAADNEGQRCLIQKLDVTDAKEIQDVVSVSEDRFGSIDVLINNAGFGYRAAVEEADDKDFQRAVLHNQSFPAVRLQPVHGRHAARRMAATTMRFVCALAIATKSRRRRIRRSGRPSRTS